MEEFKLKYLMQENCDQVFATMLGVSVQVIPAEIPIAMDSEERVVSLIGFGGDYTGNCMITSSKGLACKLASAMLMEDYPALTEEVMDAFGEISNMIFGNVKTDLEEHLGPLRLTIPTVIVGEKFNIRNVSNPAWVVVKFAVFETEQLEVRMCVTPSELSLLARPEVVGRTLAWQ